MKLKRLKETWKDIPDYEGYYQASNLGRVRSLDREVVCVDGRKRLLKSRILKYGYDKDGYCLVVFYRDSERKNFRVARLVLMVFIGKCPEGMDACHNDGIKTNNAVYNLRWDTRVSNEADKRFHGTNPEGERHGNAKLTERDVIDIRTKYKRGSISQTMLGEKFGVSQAMIYCIVNNKNWNHI